MKRNNLLFLLLLGYALLFNTGCEGCVEVKPPSEKKTGEMSVNVERLGNMNTGGEKIFMSLNYSGTLLEASGEGSVGDNSFNMSRSYEIVNGNIMPAPGINLSFLRFGKWSVRVSGNDWSSNCEVNVGKNATGSAIFTYPNTKGNCR